MQRGGKYCPGFVSAETETDLGKGKITWVEELHSGLFPRQALLPAFATGAGFAPGECLLPRLGKGQGGEGSFALRSGVLAALRGERGVCADRRTGRQSICPGRDTPTGREGGEAPAGLAEPCGASCALRCYHRWSQPAPGARPGQRSAPGAAPRSGCGIPAGAKPGMGWRLAAGSVALLTSSEAVSSSFVLLRALEPLKTRPGFVLLSRQWVGAVCLPGELTTPLSLPSPFSLPPLPSLPPFSLLFLPSPFFLSPLPSFSPLSAPQLPSTALAKQTEPGWTCTTALTPSFPARLKPVEQTNSFLQSVLLFVWFSGLIYPPLSTWSASCSCLP